VNNPNLPEKPQHVKGSPTEPLIDAIPVENVEKPQHVKGSPTEPLIDAIPVENVILSILHIIIGV
jgi:hypothetical protein